MRGGRFVQKELGGGETVELCWLYYGIFVIVLKLYMYIFKILKDKKIIQGLVLYWELLSRLSQESVDIIQGRTL